MDAGGIAFCPYEVLAAAIRPHDTRKVIELGEIVRGSRKSAVVVGAREDVVGLACYMPQVAKEKNSSD